MVKPGVKVIYTAEVGVLKTKAPLTLQRPPKTPKTHKSSSHPNFSLEVALFLVSPPGKIGRRGGHSCNYMYLLLSTTLIGKARPFSGDELFSQLTKPHTRY